MSEKTAAFFNIGDEIVFGKFYNRRAIITGFGDDGKGNPTVEVQVMPSGTKKVMNLFKIRHQKTAATAENVAVRYTAEKVAAKVVAAKPGDSVERQLGVCGFCNPTREGGFLKVQNDRLSLHGYKRPGHGYVEGQCPGAKELALEVSPVTLDTLIEYLDKHISEADRRIKYLETTDTFLPSSPYHRGGPLKLDTSKEKDWAFEDARKNEIKAVEWKTKMMRDDLATAKKERAKWKPVPLTSIDEVVQEKKEKAEKVRLDRLKRYEGLRDKAKARIHGIYQKLLANEAKLKQIYQMPDPDDGKAFQRRDKARKVSMDVFTRAQTLYEWFYRGIGKLADAYPGDLDMEDLIKELDAYDMNTHLNLEDAKEILKDHKYKDFPTYEFSYTTDRGGIMPIAEWKRPFWRGFKE